MIENFQQIFFDLDDTLVNTRETATRRIRILLDEFQLKIKPSEVYNLIGLPNRESELKKHLRNSQAFWKRYEQLRTEVVVSSFDNVTNHLEKLVSKGIKLGIITNNGHSKTLKKLQFADISEDLFSLGIYSCSDFGFRKPSSRIVETLNQPLKNALYVGDDLLDYNFARNIGADFYAVCSGFYNVKDFLGKSLPSENVFLSVAYAFE